MRMAHRTQVERVKGKDTWREGGKLKSASQQTKKTAFSQIKIPSLRAYCNEILAQMTSARCSLGNLITNLHNILFEHSTHCFPPSK